MYDERENCQQPIWDRMVSLRNSDPRWVMLGISGDTHARNHEDAIGRKLDLGV
jgi:hypothetical protein